MNDSFTIFHYFYWLVIWLWLWLDNRTSLTFRILAPDLKWYSHRIVSAHLLYTLSTALEGGVQRACGDFCLYCDTWVDSGPVLLANTTLILCGLVGLPSVIVQAAWAFRQHPGCFHRK